MKKTKKYRNTLLFMAALSMGTMVTSCSDWDDHYDANSANSVASANYTLWENIKNDTSLTQFAQLVKKAGYENILNTSQTYTIWAPKNGTFDYSTLIGEDSTKLLNEFIKNHIARYNFPASGELNEKVYLLNKKMEYFTGADSYTFGDINVENKNIASSNGILHKLSGKVTFFTNIYEYLSAGKYDLDSLKNYIHKYDKKTLDTENSVVGPTVNGEITYLDSVFIEDNSLFKLLGRAYINREDSNYTMIMPTNTGWNKAYNNLSKYFNYIPSMKFINLSSGETSSVTQDNVYMSDSMIHLSIIRDLIFNNRMYANSALKTYTPDGTLKSDSLVTTTYGEIFGDEQTDLFKGATKETMSNGYCWITDSLRIKPWYSWCPEIILEGEYNSYRTKPNTEKGTQETVTVSAASQNSAVSGSVSNGRYVDIVPYSSAVNPEVDFYLPSLLSTSYDIYCVFVPANILSNNVSKILPNNVKFTLGYQAANGTQKTVSLGTYSNTIGKVDTVYIGTFDFPVTTAGLTTTTETVNYNQYLKLKSTVSSTETGKYDREMRIDCIIMRPTELNNYIKEHPGYEYKKNTITY